MTDTQFADAPETKLHFLDYWRIIRIRKIVILAVWFLVILTAVVVTFLLKPQYASTVRMAVEKENPDVGSPLATTQMMQLPYDPFWIQSQFEIIQSSEILKEVVRKFKLNEVWAAKYGIDGKFKVEEAVEILQKKMKVRQVRNTSFIEITVIDENPEQAAELANSVAEVYQAARMEDRRKAKLGGIKTLEKRLEEKNQEVAAAQQIVYEMRRTNDITELETAFLNNGGSVLENETLRRVELSRIDVELEYTQFKKLLDGLTQRSRDDLRAALPTALFPPDQQLNNLQDSLSIAQQRLTALLQEQTRENPEVKKAQAVVDKIEGAIDDRVNGILNGLQIKVSTLKERLDAATKEVEAIKNKQAQTADRTRTYFDAKRDLDNVQRLRDALKLKIDGEIIEASLPTSTAVKIWDKAIPDLRPVKPNKPLNIILGTVIGLILGVGLAFFIEYLDTSVKTIDDVERALQAPVLGVIPQEVGTLVFQGPDTPHAEAYRVLRTNILFSRKDEGANTITVVSGGVGEGKSTTLLNLATIFAQNGDRVLVVDSDLRRPSLHKVLKLSNSVGLTNYLLRQNSLEEVIQTTNIPTLDFLPSGKLPSSSMGILNSDQMKNLITELKSRYDFVFFDSPPIMGVSDASVLASEVDMTLQVIQYRRYPQPMTIRAKQMIQKVGGNLIGIVLNNINMSSDESYYYYSGYYHDYYSKQDDDGDVKSSKQPTSKAGV